MPNNLPQPQQSDHVEIGDLFKTIGKLFSNLFNFVGSLLRKLFIAFVWLIFFIKKHALKLFISGVLGIGLGFLFEGISTTVYKSSISIKQNYPVGESLYNSIDYYSSLIKQGDSLILQKVLMVPQNIVSSITGFEITPSKGKNDMMKTFDAYRKPLDSAVAAMVDYPDFVRNYKAYLKPYQEITIRSKERKSFKKVFGKIVSHAEQNPFFKKQRDEKINQLTELRAAINKSLEKSDTLISVYEQAIIKSAERNNDLSNGITLRTQSGGNSTKEYQLYLKNIELRRELVQIEKEIAENDQIIEVISENQSDGIIDNRRDFLGYTIGFKLFFGLSAVLFVFVLLLFLRFLKFLEQFKPSL